MCVHHGGHTPIYPQVISILAVGGEPPEFSYILSNRFSNVLSALVKVETFCYYQGLWFNKVQASAARVLVLGRSGASKFLYKE